ncbi:MULTISPECIES: hypothetical protein [Actinotignum]|uniref:hypothetical protein n=1 Tax=Actinotignum TaxID=1653174 RepID=UPI002A7EC013|nr:hypothetical protein [Actinotignum timonense]MDY5158856.1 hypothetical protein [Actinotignum timonense]
MTILVIGDAIANQREAETPFRAGTMFKVAVNLAHLAREVRMVTNISEASDPQVVRDYAAAHGVELLLRPATSPVSAASNSVSAALTSELPTPPPAAFTDAHYGDSHADPEESWDILPAPERGARKLDFDLFSPSATIFGGDACHAMPAAHTVREWLRVCRSTSTIIYSPALRHPRARNLDRVRIQAESFLQLSDVVVATSKDIRLLYGISGPENEFAAVAEHWFSFGPRLVAILLEDGAALMITASGDRLHVASLPRPFVDVAGARSAFIATTIDTLDRVSLLGREASPGLATMSMSHLYTVGAFATTARSLMTAHAGWEPLTRNELSEGFFEYQSREGLI